MVLAENAKSGDEIIVVQKGQFVLRGVYVRVGAEIPDLYEERMVVDVSSNEEHTPGLTKLRLGVPLRFFHPARELVSTVLLPSMELAKRLETSDTQVGLLVLIDTSTRKESCPIPAEGDSSRSEVVTSVITSFEVIDTLPVTSPKLQIGPSMSYIVTWDGVGGSREASPEVSVIRDHLSDRKLKVYWEGLVLQAGTSNKTVRLGDVRHITRWNGYLSLLLPIATKDATNLFCTKSDDFQMTYNNFRKYYCLSPTPNEEEEENDGRLELPLAYLRKHFQTLAQLTHFLVDGYKCVQVFDLLNRVLKDVQDRPPTVCEDQQGNHQGLEIIQSACRQIEESFVGNQCTGQITWPQLLFFVRYNRRLTTPDIFPLPKPQILVDSRSSRKNGIRKVAEVVSGMYSQRLLIVYYDGIVEVWKLTCKSAIRVRVQSLAQVFFSTRKRASKEGEEISESFMDSWMEANETLVGDLKLSDTDSKQFSARIHQFKRSAGNSGTLVRFCAWDSVFCANSTILQEPGSGSFRFFRIADSFVCPIRQVVMQHVKVDLSTKTKTPACVKNAASASSSGIIKTFEVTSDGSKAVFLTGSNSVVWVACTGTGEIICHANLQASQVGKFSTFFQITETVLGSGGIQTQLYATTSAKSYRHVGMWVLPAATETLASFEREKTFSFGKSKAGTVVNIAVSSGLLFVAARDGALIVWSTISHLASPVAPLVCLHIPLYNEEIQSLSCQPLGQITSVLNTNMVQAGDTAAADIDQWEVGVLQKYGLAPLRFALYLFDDGEIIRLPVAGHFDVRLVTLDDPAFEFDVFLTPVSGVEHNAARRVSLEKHRIIRVVFIALHHSRDGIFAQKSVQAFFQDCEKHGVLWKTRDDMKKFAASYEENVFVEQHTFYRNGDGEHVDLVKSHKSRVSNSKKHVVPVLAVGVTLKGHRGDQTQFQVWKFAINSFTDDIHSEVGLEVGQLAHARQVLALQSSYRIEAERLVRIRNNSILEDHLSFARTRQAAMVRGIKDSVRDIIARNEQREDVADNLLNAVNVLMLASFDARMVYPVENFVCRIFSQNMLKSEDAGFELPRTDTRSFISFLQTENDKYVCYAPWLKQLYGELASTSKLGSRDSIWSWFSLVLRHIEASTLSTAEVGSLLIDLGLADAFDCIRNTMCVTENGFPSTSSLPSLMIQLNRTLTTTGEGTSTQLALGRTMDLLLTPRAVVEFVLEYTDFKAFYRAKMAHLQTRVTALLSIESHQHAPEASYAIQCQIHRWQQELRELAQSQNELSCEISECEDVIKEPTVNDLQELKRFLKTPLPNASPIVSSITLEEQCDTIVCRDRFVVNAQGRLAGAGAEFVSLSVVYLILETDKEREEEFQQELTFLRKIQHLRVRQYFLPTYLDIMNVPILPAGSASMIYTGDTDAMHCLVTDSLLGWSSLTECIKLLRLSSFPREHLRPFLWFWSLRVLMVLLTMQNEKFALRQGVDIDMLLVSPDGCDLRLCSIAGGIFTRYGEDGNDAESLSQAMAKIFGCFIYDLLHLVCTNEGINEHISTSLAVESDELDLLRKMRGELIRLLFIERGENNVYDAENNPFAALTDFSSISRIVACGIDSREGEELENLCQLALLTLQPPTNRLRLESLWVYAGRPEWQTLPEESQQLKVLSRRMMTILKMHRFLQKMLHDLQVCFEESNNGVGGITMFRRVMGSWITVFKQLFQLKPPGFGLDNEDLTNAHTFEQTLTQILRSSVPYQLSTIALQLFTQCSKRADRDQGNQTIQTLLEGFVDVFKLIEANTSFDELRGNPLLVGTAQQILDSLKCVASGRIPPSGLNAKALSISSRFHRDVAANAVLWRICEPCFRHLLAIETSSSKRAILLRWLESRRPSFGFVSTLAVGYEGDQCTSGPVGTTANQELILWWSDHTPLTPQNSSSNAADELGREGHATEILTTANYLRCVYETKEIEFKLTSGVSVPKFRLAVLQQFFGPTFFERKHCFPMIFVKPLVATVWSDLAFEGLICTLLRDSDEKIVLGALSLLECSTRVFRYDALQRLMVSPSKQIAADATLRRSRTSLIFSCPERDFAVRLCSQNIVLEVKRVLERITRYLKVLGESGTASASRSQHPLIAIICVGMSWLVNCLHGGDRATQFWLLTGVDQFLLTHCKANSLPFVKVKDSNMINQVFHRGHRHEQDLATASKWQVFTSTFAESLLHHSSAGRNISPFRLMINEIVIVGSNRTVSLMRVLLLSRIFRQETALIDNLPAVARELAFQQDLISSSDYAKVSHTIDLARDITQLNGTTNEQIQLILYTRATFLHHTATAAKFWFRVFVPVLRTIWGWMGAAWRMIVLQLSSKAAETNEKADNGVQAQGYMILAGFSLLHSILTHPLVAIEDIVEITTFDTGNDDEMVNIFHEIFTWISNMPPGVSRPQGSTLSVLIESATVLLTTSVQRRKYDNVALEAVTTCVGVRVLLEILEMDDAFETGGGKTIVSISEKQQLWSMLLYFDSRSVTSRILDLEFLDIAVFSRLLTLGLKPSSGEDELNILNRRLEAVLLLEVLVLAASRRPESVNTHMLFAEICKLLLHNDIISKEAQYLRKLLGSSGKTKKQVAVSKRVIQLVCCLCVDFSSHRASRVFLGHLESVGVPAWIVSFHQAQPEHHDRASNEHELVSRVELFWRDWQGRGSVGARPIKRMMVLEPFRKHTAKKCVVQATPRIKRSTSQASEPHVDISTSVEILDSDDDTDEKELTRSQKFVLSGKVSETASATIQKARSFVHDTVVAKKDSSVVHTLLSIDADSALQMINKKAIAPQKTKHRTAKDEEALDSDAYSPFPAGSSSEDENRRASRKTKIKRIPSMDQKSRTDRESKDNDSKLEQDSTAIRQTRVSEDSSESDASGSSRARPRRRPPKHARTPTKFHFNCVASRQYEALREIFNKYDVDGDGAISFIDLRRALDKQTATRLTDLEIQRWITEKDRGGQGVVSFVDFAEAFKGQLK
ncbi:unnamed protein product [Phytophthora fragariaefolia]|uniref:Unnamed protein product n=1 Tax=Phytophthora fragariaefolia TaxID=1490495 RepID=A0A9W6WVV3_9STRA|nr:unnamed protein product [Phytophthora fragariaefolia]